MSDLYERLQIRYQGRLLFSVFSRGHASWCHVKVVQGPHQTLVVLTSEDDNPGTFIANGATFLATLVVNLFELEPEATIFLERTPPVDRHADWRQWAAQEIPSHAHSLPVSTLFGTSEDKYERIIFTWSESSDYDGPHYTASHPTWRILKPVEVIRQFQEL